MRKKQKTNKKKQSQRAYKDFITIVKWHKYHFDVISHISNIYTGILLLFYGRNKTF